MAVNQAQARQMILNKNGRSESFSGTPVPDQAYARGIRNPSWNEQELARLALAAIRQYKQNIEGMVIYHDRDPFPTNGFDALDIASVTSNPADADERHWLKIVLSNGGENDDFYWKPDRARGYPQSFAVNGQPPASSNRYWFIIGHRNGIEIEGFSQESDFFNGPFYRNGQYWFYIEYIPYGGVEKWSERNGLRKLLTEADRDHGDLFIYRDRPSLQVFMSELENALQYGQLVNKDFIGTSDHLWMSRSSYFTSVSQELYTIARATITAIVTHVFQKGGWFVGVQLNGAVHGNWAPHNETDYNRNFDIELRCNVTTGIDFSCHIKIHRILWHDTNDVYDLAAHQQKIIAEIEHLVKQAENYFNARYYGHKSDKDAVSNFRVATDQGNAIAQYNLGIMYEYGFGSLIQNNEEAIRLYHLAANQDYVPAQNRLRRMGINRQAAPNIIAPHSSFLGGAPIRSRSEGRESESLSPSVEP